MKQVIKWAVRIFCFLIGLYFIFWGVFISFFIAAPESGIPIIVIGVLVIIAPLLPWKRILKL